MKTIYVITFGRACPGDTEDVYDAFAECNGAYTDKDRALKALTATKDEFVKELREEQDIDNTLTGADITVAYKVYGSEAEEYYEIDFEDGDGALCEIYIKLSEVNLI
jgi:hypothetical protein